MRGRLPIFEGTSIPAPSTTSPIRVWGVPQPAASPSISGFTSSLSDLTMDGVILDCKGEVEDDKVGGEYNRNIAHFLIWMVIEEKY